MCACVRMCLYVCVYVYVYVCLCVCVCRAVTNYCNEPGTDAAAGGTSFAQGWCARKAARISLEARSPAALAAGGCEGGCGGAGERGEAGSWIRDGQDAPASCASVRASSFPLSLSSHADEKLSMCLASLKERLDELVQRAAPPAQQRARGGDAVCADEDADPALAKCVTDMLEILRRCLELTRQQGADVGEGAADVGEGAGARAAAGGADRASVLGTRLCERVGVAIAKVVCVLGWGLAF